MFGAGRGANLGREAKVRRKGARRSPHVPQALRPWYWCGKSPGQHYDGKQDVTPGDALPDRCNLGRLVLEFRPNRSTLLRLMQRGHT
jgi:hypothetical protein